MRSRLFAVPLLLTLLSACAPSQPVATTDTMASSAATAASSAESSVSSVPALPYEEAMDATFSSQTLGISFRYPSRYYDSSCDQMLPVEARERMGAVDLVPTEVYDGACALIIDPTAKEQRQKELTSTINAQRAETEEEVREFIDRVFSPDCIITERAEDVDVTRLFLSSKNPPADEPDFTCSESILWRLDPRVVVFSPLGSKTGGGVEWPAKEPFLSADGTEEYSFDYAIMQSIRYLQP